MNVGDGFDVRSLAVIYRNGHHLAAHVHPWAQLIYARSGVIHVIAAGRLWLTPPTRAIWIPHGMDHAIDFKGETALRTLYVSAERAGTVEPAVRNVGGGAAAQRAHHAHRDLGHARPATPRA